MPNITFIDHEGTSQTIEANTGESLMEAATSNDVSGIDADCGGACACATCHIYVDDNWFSKLGEVSNIEKEMLEASDQAQANSRLSCQITVSDELDGLIVTTPEHQF